MDRGRDSKSPAGWHVPPPMPAVLACPLSNGRRFGSPLYEAPFGHIDAVGRFGISFDFSRFGMSIYEKFLDWFEYGVFVA